MFKPKFVKQGEMLLKGVNKFLHYKEDILPEDKKAEIISLRDRFKQSLKARNAQESQALAPELNRACEKALPSPQNHGIRENVEVFFVAIVIALGLRAYFVQPFKIPTGSMQPTLNGIIATPTEKDERPGFLAKTWQTIFGGRTYVEIVAEEDDVLVSGSSITEKVIPPFFVITTLNFQSGKTISSWVPRDKLINDLGLGQSLGIRRMEKRDVTGMPLVTADNMPIYDYQATRRQVKKGQLLARGYVDGGDQVLVDKFSYHFRKPKRGEVFVFNTRGIKNIEARPDFNAKWGSQHYIKRLAGLPGDQLEVKIPVSHQPTNEKPGGVLWVNGEPGKEFGFQRVASMEGKYTGYSPAVDDYDGSGAWKWPLTLKPKKYMAMGDNSPFSYDSRMWGPVPEENLVGPGMFVYWPLNSHWGRIR